MFKFSLGSFGAFPIFDDLVSRKQLVVKQNWQNLSVLGKYILWTVKYSSLVWGHSVQFWFSVTLYFENQSSYSEIDQNFIFRGKYFLYTKYLSLLSVQGQFGVTWCISNFDDLVSTFKFSAILFVLLPVSLYLTGILLASYQAECQGPWASC